MATKKTSKKTASKKTAETKADKFVRLAPGRVIRVLNSMKSLRKLANRNSYEWTDEQAAKILGAIAEEATAIQEALSATESKKETVTFEL